MKMRYVICLLLTLCLLFMCLAGCRNDKQESAETAAEAGEETTEQEEVPEEEVAEPMIIEIPEGSEIGDIPNQPEFDDDE